jgi:hypothetical protein
LWAFSVFGHGFLINPNVDAVLKQLRKPTENILGDIWGVKIVDVPDEALGINVIYKPKQAQCFLVVFDIDVGQFPQRYSVMLPGPSADGLDVYKWLSDQRGIVNEYAIRHIAADGDYVIEHPWASIEIWTNL